MTSPAWGHVGVKQPDRQERRACKWMECSRRARLEEKDKVKD